MKKTLILPLVLLLLAMAGLASAASIRQQLTAESTIEQIIKRGVLRVGMDIFQPWAMKDKNGKLIGFEIDVATRLANDLGVKVEFVPTAWSGIIPALLTGKFDVIIGGMGITPQRSLKVNFSIPYDYSGMSLVAHRKLAAGFATLADFNRTEVQVAVKLGTTAATVAKKYLPKATLRMFDNETQLYQELRNGKVHAVIANAPRPAYEAVDYKDTPVHAVYRDLHQGADRLRPAERRPGHPGLFQQLDRPGGDGRLAQGTARLLVRHQGLGRSDPVNRACPITGGETASPAATARPLSPATVPDIPGTA